VTYNLSEKTVQRWAETLDLLKGEEVLLRATDPHKLAYRLREAIAAARANDIEPYASLLYGFKVRGELVIARPKAAFKLKPVVVSRRFESVRSEWDVVEVAGRASEDVLEFPAFRGEVGNVKRWCGVNGFDFKTEPYLVLRKKEEVRGGY